MFEEGQFSTKRWRRHLVMNEGIEVDDFQYGREGRKNRMPGRYPLRLWNRLRSPESSISPQAAWAGTSAATEGQPGPSEQIARGNPEAIHNAPRDGTETLPSTCPPCGTTSAHPNSTSIGNTPSRSHLDAGLPGIGIGPSSTTPIETAKAQVMALPKHERMALLQTLLPSLPQSEQIDIVSKFQRNASSENESATLESKFVSTTEGFPSLETGGDSGHMKDGSPHTCGAHSTHESGEHLATLVVERPTAVPRNMPTILDGQDADTDALARTKEWTQTVQMTNHAKGLRGSLRGVKEKLSRTFRRSQD